MALLQFYVVIKNLNDNYDKKAQYSLVHTVLLLALYLPTTLHLPLTSQLKIFLDAVRSIL